MNVICVVDARNRLGEVPVWDVAEQALYWVDIEGRLLQRLVPSTGKVDRWEMPERIASFALREKGGLIVAFASGIAFYDLDSGAIEVDGAEVVMSSPAVARANGIETATYGMISAANVP